MNAATGARVTLAGMRTPATTRYLTLEELSELLCVSMSTVYKWRAQGLLPKTKRLPNGRVLTRSDWLDQWLDELPS